jgi:beta-mannosidase
MGEQKLYNLRVELQESGTAIHSKGERIGLRTIELITDKDEIGNSFHFKINGRPVFMKGANYIPQDSFLDRVSPEKYEHVIQSAVDANMNMLRVWGGGIYEKDIFYDLCDEKGILIWQDFMFACAMYPGDTDFLENVKQEAVDNIKRLRNHASIALWCGNNESLSAWYNWGWKDNVISEQGQEVADLIWKGYEDIFHNILPEVVEEYDKDKAYWSSSSSAGTGITENLKQGDLHYWGVWWGKEPFSKFKENTGRFMSEYGFQSFPEMKTIQSYALEEDLDIYSEVMRSHQRSSIGNETIELYMKRDYKEPKDFPSFIYVGQVLQGEGIKRAIELHRVQMPYCMGSLYWQINDCWPVASWSGMDYYGRWKALHYMAKEAFKNVILVVESEEGISTISTVSDLNEHFMATLKCRIIDFKGKLLWDKTMDVEVVPNTSRKVFSFEQENIDFDMKNSVLEVSISHNNREIDNALWYYLSPKELDLIGPNINMESRKINDEEYSIELNSDVLVKNIFLEAKNSEGVFSQNYFDMLPGKKYVVNFKSEDRNIPDFVYKELSASF